MDGVTAPLLKGEEAVTGCKILRSGFCRRHDYFVLGILAPDLRAVFRAIATACFKGFPA